MKNRKIKILCLFLILFSLTGCTKYITDENKKTVKYDATLICNSCESKCNEIDNENEEEKATCKKECNEKCTLAKKNQTGQNLTSNILCRPTNKDVLEIYEMYNINLKDIPECNNFTMFSNYEGLWISIFVKPLAWIIIKIGELLNNYGLSLIIVSIAIRAALMPLTKKTAMQSENLKKAQSDIDRINKKYENKQDQQSQMQKSQELMLIYKKYDINPLSNCLFAFIQIPLLFAFIEAINRTPAIFEGSFLGFHLGITPLTALKSGKWWYLIIVILLALVTYMSFNLNKGASAGGIDTEKQMQMMSKIMIIFIVFTSFSLSTAICLYWISSSTFTIFQNLLVKRVKK